MAASIKTPSKLKHLNVFVANIYVGLGISTMSCVVHGARPNSLRCITVLLIGRSRPPHHIGELGTPPYLRTHRTFKIRSMHPLSPTRYV